MASSRKMTYSTLRACPRSKCQTMTPTLSPSGSMERPEFLRTSLSCSQQVAFPPFPYSPEAVLCAITLSSRRCRVVGEEPDFPGFSHRVSPRLWSSLFSSRRRRRRRFLGTLTLDTFQRPPEAAFLTVITLGHIDIPCPVVNRCLRIRAHGQSAIYNAVRQMRSDDLFRCYAVLNPAIPRLHDIVLRIVLWKTLIGAAENVGAGPVAAMMHSRLHEQAIEVVHRRGIHVSRRIIFALAHHVDHRSVILYGSDGRNGMIGPAVIHDQFSAVGLKRREVRVGRVLSSCQGC